MAGGAQFSGREGTGDAILMVVAVCVFLAVVWWLFGESISTYVYLFFWFQARGMVSLYDQMPTVFQAWVRDLIDTMHAFRPGDFGSLLDLASAGGRFWMLAESVVFGGFIFLLSLRGAPRIRFRRKIDLPFLIRENAKLWPALRPIVGLDLISQDPDEGPWARGKTEYQFAIEHGILQTPTGEKVCGGDFRQAEKVYRSPSEEIDYVFKRSRAREVFRRQLSGYGRHPVFWPGFERLDPVMRWVCAVCVAFLCDDERCANFLIDDANNHYRYDPKRASVHLGLPMREVDKTLARFQKDARVVLQLTTHHMTFSVVSGLWMAAKARAGRRLLTNRMRWLKTVDRTLFYALNQIGRQTAWVEAAAIRAALVIEHDVLRYQDANGKPPPYEGNSMGEAVLRSAVENSVYSLEKTLAEQRWFVSVEE